MDLQEQNKIALHVRRVISSHIKRLATFPSPAGLSLTFLRCGVFTVLHGHSMHVLCIFCMVGVIFRVCVWLPLLYSRSTLKEMCTVQKPRNHWKGWVAKSPIHVYCAWCIMNHLRIFSYKKKLFVLAPDPFQIFLYSMWDKKKFFPIFFTVCVKKLSCKQSF